MRRALVFAFGVALLGGCAGLTTLSKPTPVAVAVLNPTQGNTTNGSVSMVQKGDKIMVDARVEGLTPGLHGFHLHEKGDCSAPDATSAGGHFNPGNRPHGGPEHGERHAGDWGNLSADASGKASLQIAVPASQLSLDPRAVNSAIGKAIIVHADPDDYKTQPTGNAGKRVACGIVQVR